MKKSESILDAAVLIAVPLTLALCGLFQFDRTALLSAVVVAAALLIFALGYERSKPGLRQICPTVVFTALAVAGRILFAPIPDVKPVSAICIMAGILFGRRSGFLVGVLTALLSNVFFGQGSWTPWQMYAWGLMGYLAGVLAAHGAFEHKAVVYVYGFLAPLVYGFLLNSYTLVGFVHPITWPSAVLTYGAGLPFDVVHGVATVLFLLVLYAPWRKKMERIMLKYDLAGVV